MEQRQNPGLTLDERDFSYHGPIPFSKETAVVMMADSVEAASRSIKNPTEQKINDLIENIINKQMETNQFVNANITLKEINTVKKVLKKKLMNIYHVRIAYPD
jgi:membrane-associated HD superfamily phosphohydrolase